MNKIRKGDEVVVIAGRDKGRRGTVIKVLEGQVLVENINMVKRHTKPNPQRQIQGGIIEKEAAIDLSNVMRVEPGDEEGRSRRSAHARRRPQGALLQVQQGSSRRVRRRR